MGRPKKAVIKKEPAFLQFVLKAISKLKDHHGSTASKILEYVRSHLKTPENKPLKSHVIISEVQKALEHGVENGLLKVKPGKYTLGPKILQSSNGNTGDTNATYQSSTGNASTASCESCKKRKTSKQRKPSTSQESHKPPPDKSTTQSKKQKSTTTQDGSIFGQVKCIAEALALCDSSPNHHHTKALRILSRSNSRLILSKKVKPTKSEKGVAKALAPSDSARHHHALPHKDEDDSIYS